MAEQLTPDICVIGAGAGGLSVAAAAAAFGVPVVLIESGKMGGDCLNTGCVPSKALIAAAKRAEAHRAAARRSASTRSARRRFRQGQRAHAARHRGDRAERFQGALHRARRARDRGRSAHSTIAATVVGRRRLRDHGAPLRHRDRLDAGGAADSRPRQGPYLTNETHVRTERAARASDRPRRRRRSGSNWRRRSAGSAATVTVLEAAQPLAQDDPECAAIVLDALAREGITIRSGVKVDRRRACGGTVDGSDRAGRRAEETSTAPHLLVAAGRQADDRWRSISTPPAFATTRRHRGRTASCKTSNRRVYAIGDVAGLPRFTHAANHQAGLVIRQRAVPPAGARRRRR